MARNRATAIVTCGDKVLLVRDRGRPTYALPGGGVEDDERPESAVVRELLEETTLEAINITHLFTFGGNPASAAAGMANLDIMEGEGMVQNSAEMGDYLYEQLQTLYEHRIVGDVRGGMGLLCAVELVKDRETRERFPADAELGKKINPLMDKYGLMGRAGDVISLAPPLCITRDEVDHLVKSLDGIITELETKL